MGSHTGMLMIQRQVKRQHTDTLWVYTGSTQVQQLLITSAWWCLHFHLFPILTSISVLKQHCVVCLCFCMNNQWTTSPSYCAGHVSANTRPQQLWQPGDGDCYIMHRMQSGGWPYSKVGWDSSKALSLRTAVLHAAVLHTAVLRTAVLHAAVLRTAVLCAAVFHSKIVHSSRNH